MEPTKVEGKLHHRVLTHSGRQQEFAPQLSSKRTQLMRLFVQPALLTGKNAPPKLLAIKFLNIFSSNPVREVGPRPGDVGVSA